MKLLVLSVLLLVPRPATAQALDHSAYDSVTRSYTSDRGVDYSSLQANRSGLDRYVALLGSVTEQRYASWDRSVQLAYLINAYNALVLVAVIDHYPIKRSLNPTALIRPANSVWQIPGFFSDRKYRVAGRDLTLDDIEHKLLRAEFKEPRIHAALVCAARSCPPLRAEAYVPAAIDTQLDEQMRSFLGDSTRNRFDRTRGEVKLSEIFKWFNEDFGKERGVLAFVARYLDAPTQNWLRAGKYRVTYFDYDWTLNDASAR